jgi:hypothetical protein
MKVCTLPRWIRHTLETAAIVVSINGCTATKNATAEAISATSTFHSQSNSEEFGNIYNGAASYVVLVSAAGISVRATCRRRSSAGP